MREWKYRVIDGEEIKPYDIFDMLGDGTKLHIERIDNIIGFYDLDEDLEGEIVQCSTVREVISARQLNKLIQLDSDNLASSLASLEGIKNKWSKKEELFIIR